MSDVQHLLAEYIAEHRAGGEAEPGRFLSRASPAERDELMALIDAYLARAPRQSFDADGYRGSTAERTVDELERALRGQSGLWPALLPQLRHRAGLKRAELVERLAETLGVGDKTGKVGEYYHQMEQGLLPARGVSQRVLDALGRLVGESPDALREAGNALRPPERGDASGQAMFARRAQTQVAAPSPPIAMQSPGTEEPDEVDELFRSADS